MKYKFVIIIIAICQLCQGQKDAELNSLKIQPTSDFRTKLVIVSSGNIIVDTIAEFPSSTLLIDYYFQNPDTLGVILGIYPTNLYINFVRLNNIWEPKSDYSWAITEPIGISKEEYVRTTYKLKDPNIPVQI